jgi:uncharacterized protein (DUF362 family)
MRITRRSFSRMSALAGLGLAGKSLGLSNEARVPVAIVKTTDRKFGFQKAVELLGGIDYSGRDVYLKCSYNSPDPYPATTHPETLSAITALLREKGSGRIRLVERSGMGLTREILGKLGTLEQIEKLGIDFLPLEEIASKDWQKVDLPGSHWANGIEIPAFLTQKAGIVQVCNLKTHRFGGQFSASLKNSIGIIAKYSATHSHNYMSELHASKYQCAMIAEANVAYSPDLVLMDAIQVFIKGGPESGELAHPGMVAASRDRVALDSVGLALLHHFGAEVPVSQGAILAHEQLKRAVELGFGIKSEKEIQFLTLDKAGQSMAAQLEGILNKK